MHDNETPVYNDDIITVDNSKLVWSPSSPSITLSSGSCLISDMSGSVEWASTISVDNMQVSDVLKEKRARGFIKHGSYRQKRCYE
jgi:hypothetical protein